VGNFQKAFFFLNQGAFDRTAFSFFKLLLPTQKSVDIATTIRLGKPRKSGSIFPTLIRKCFFPKRPDQLCSPASPLFS